MSVSRIEEEDIDTSNGDNDDFPLTQNISASIVRRHNTVSGHPSPSTYQSPTAASKLYRISNAASGSASPGQSSSGGSGSLHRQRPSQSAVGSERAGKIAASTATAMPYEQDHNSAPRSAVSSGTSDSMDHDELLAYGMQPAGLARHSSMPLSTRVRQPTNPGAPWGRERSVEYAGPASAENVNRLRSNSSTEQANRSTDSGNARSPPLSSTANFNLPSSPMNSGFVVTSRPNSLSLSSGTTLAAATSGHGRSSSTATAASLTDSSVAAASAWERAGGHSYSQSMHAPSESYTTTLGRSSSATSGQHSRGQSESHVRSNSVRQVYSSNPGSTQSSASPVSPVDARILGATSPWSPTPEEKVQLRTQASIHGHPSQAAPQEADEDTLVSPPRRATSLQQQQRTTAGHPSATANGGRGGATGLNRSGSVRYSAAPVRRSTPLLPQLTTAQEDLYAAAVQAGQDSQAYGAVNSAASSGESAAQYMSANGPSGLGRASSNGSVTSRVIRGPASASPFVPHIGHTQQLLDAANQKAAAAAAGNASTNAGLGLSRATSLRDPKREKERRAGPGLFNLDTTYESVAPPVSYPVSQQAPAGLSPTPTAASFGQQLPSAFTAQTAANAMSFPTLLGNAQSAQAFQTNLVLQQQLLNQQAQALQEQQAQLTAMMQSGMTLRDGPSAFAPTPLSSNGMMDPYTIAARIDALQKANAALVAAGQAQAQTQAQAQPQPPPSAGYAGTFAPFSPLPHNGFASPAMSVASPLPHQNGFGHQLSAPPTPVFPPAPYAPDVAALVAAKGYNPPVFNLQPQNARFFVIKSFTEDDVFKSIKFEIWSSTPLGNNRLDKAFKESSNRFAGDDEVPLGDGPRGPIYLLFSVNASGHFCGVAEMLTPLDYSATANVWAQNDKWKGSMQLRWIYVRDIPNTALRHLKLTNTNEQKPVTSSRDTQEVPYEQGCQILMIFSTFNAKTTLLQDLAYYERQMQQQSGSRSQGHSPQPHSTSHFAQQQQYNAPSPHLLAQPFQQQQQAAFVGHRASPQIRR